MSSSQYCTSVLGPAPVPTNQRAETARDWQDAQYWRAGIVDLIDIVLTDPAAQSDAADRLICEHLLADIRDSEGEVLIGAYHEWQARWPVETDKLVRIARDRDAAGRRAVQDYKALGRTHELIIADRS